MLVYPTVFIKPEETSVIVYSKSCKFFPNGIILINELFPKIPPPNIDYPYPKIFVKKLIYINHLKIK